jgi:5'-nucleotidase
MPASINSPMRWGEEVLGPSVHTIFARRIEVWLAHLPCVEVCEPTRKGVVRRLLPGLAAIFVCVGCVVTRDPPNLVGQDVRLTLIHTSDIHSRLFPYDLVPNRFDQELGLLPENAPFGGAARMATIAKREREGAARSLWLDSGDSFQGAPVFNMFKGEAELKTMTAMGVDGAVIGNHEFDAGTLNLVEQIRQYSRFPMLVANYEFEDPKVFNKPTLRDVAQPFQIYDVEGLKVGVIGMGNWSSMTGIFEGGNSLGIRPRIDGEVVREQIRFLRSAVDVVIVLSHLGLDEDEDLAAQEVSEDQNRALPADGLDMILGGHLHIVLSPAEIIHTDIYGKNTYLTHPGAFAKFVARHDLIVRVGEDNSDPERRSHIRAVASKIIPVDATIDADPEISELLRPYEEELRREIDLDGVFAYVNLPDNGKLLRNDPSGGDSQLGNLVARSMQVRPSVGADFAITNSLGIRADFEPGPLTMEETYNTFPFENTITVMQLSGREVQDTLDFVARKSAERGCRTQIQIAGLNFDMICRSDGRCPGEQKACAKNIVIGEKCRRNGNGEFDPDGEIDSAASGCVPLVADGNYRVAVNDYIAAGGSGFSVLRANPFKSNTGVSLRDSLINYLRGLSACTDELDFTDPDLRPIREVYGEIACLSTVEGHDGRIKPVQ